jgi:hypothetical protein
METENAPESPENKDRNPDMDSERKNLLKMHLPCRCVVYATLTGNAPTLAIPASVGLPTCY